MVRLARSILVTIMGHSIWMRETRSTFRVVRQGTLVSIFSAVIFYIGLSLTRDSDLKARPIDQTPIWRVNVRTLGYKPWSGGESGDAPVTIGQISFISDAELSISFVSHIVPEALPRRTHPESANLRLNAVFIDSKTGQVRARREWPTTTERSRVTPIRRRQIRSCHA